MTSKTVEIERRDGVATVWMNRPDKHNAFDAHLIDGLTEAFSELAEEDAVRVVILAGRGRSFSAGADLKWMLAAAEAGFETNFEDARQLAQMLKTVASSRKPTIARIHGQALGGGVGLAAACDICIASLNAHFAMTEVRMGLIPATIGPYVLRAIGPRQAQRYFLTGERLSAARAVEIGLAHEAVEIEHLDMRIAKIAESLVQGGPDAQAAAKLLVRSLSGRAIDDALIDETARLIARTRASKEAKEGIGAFLGKGPPQWLK
jgi:methylglutaconyl-CoA hydratase